MELQFLLATGCCRCRSPPDVVTYSPLCALADSHVETPRSGLLHRPVEESQVHTVDKEVRVC